MRVQLKRLVSFVGLVAALVGAGHQAHAQSHQQIQAITIPQISAVEKTKGQRTPAQEKISSALLDTIAQKNTGSVNKNAPNLKPEPLERDAVGVQVDIKAKVSQELLDEIAKTGKVISQHPRFDAVRASVPLSAIEALAARADVQSIAPAAKATTNRGQAVAGEGAIAHTVDLARTEFGLSGQGVVACVISDSLDDNQNSLAKAKASGAINGTKLHVLPGQEGQGSGEGLAMLEIVHAVAPDAELWFATGFSGAEQMAENILDLQAKGCQVIVDDVTYFNESPFQDGPIAMAVREVSDAGVLYFSSARNSGNLRHGTSGTWEGDFVDGGPAGAKFEAKGVHGRIHVFVPGITLNTADKAGADDRVDLFWSDPLGGSNNGYDLFVVNRYGQIVRASTTSHTGIQDPYQFIDGLHPGESIVIVKEVGAQDRFLHLDTGRAVLRHGTVGSVRGHNASGAENAFSVAAKKVSTPSRAFLGTAGAAVETFSSDGPRRMFFDTDGVPFTPGAFSSKGGKLIRKPDIAAADGVSTSLPAGSGLNPFFGTSAAAPHAAGIATLLLSCAPRPSASQVRKALEQSALPLEGAAPNETGGFGVVMARTAALAVCKPHTITTAQAVPSPSVAALARR